jgi:DNA-binding MarR family transcriptional regulator
MLGPIDSRQPLVGFSDELIRLNGRLKALFAKARRPEGLGDPELTTLNAVVEASQPPTVPQIGRSLGVLRQVVQRAANSLTAAGLVEAVKNPHHKRAVLLRPTQRGLEMKRGIDARAVALPEATAGSVDPDLVRQAALLLNQIRTQLEARLRAGGRT